MKKQISVKKPVRLVAAALVLSALALTLFSIAVFAHGLGLPIPVFGRLLGG